MIQKEIKNRSKRGEKKKKTNESESGLTAANELLSPGPSTMELRNYGSVGLKFFPLSAKLQIQKLFRF